MLGEVTSVRLVNTVNNTFIELPVSNETEGEVRSLFSYTFTEDAYGPYTISYTTTNRGLVDSQTGTLRFENTLVTKHGSDGPEETDTSSNDKKVSETSGSSSSTATIGKEAVGFDTDNDYVWWKLTITVPAGSKIDDPYVFESPLRGNDSSSANKDMNCTWDEMTITDGSGSVLNLRYEIVKRSPKGKEIDAIHFLDSFDNTQSLDDMTIVINVPVKYHFDGNPQYFINWVDLYEGLYTQKNEDSADITYAPEYEISKSHSTYDPNTKTITWRLEVNKDKKIYNPDVIAVVKDVLPTGLTFVEGSFKYWVYHTNQAATIVQDADLQQGVRLGSLTSDPWGNHSGVNYICEYQTKVDDAELDAEKSFTNTAYLYEESGIVPLISTTDTVKVERGFLNKSHKDLSVDIIEYVIEVNAEKLKLSDNGTLSLSDTIPDGVELVVDGKSTVSFTDSETGGNAVSGCSPGQRF